MSDLPSQSLGLTDEQERLAQEEARLNRNISTHAVGAKGQAYLQAHGMNVGGAHHHEPVGPRKLNLKPPESWVDLHREYADILDAASLQKFRKEFQAFGNTDGYITPADLRETMVTFFGQDDITLAQAEESVAEVDYDQDGAISYREFLEVMCAIKSGDRNRRSKFGNFYKVITLKNPPFWQQRVGKY